MALKRRLFKGGNNANTGLKARLWDPYDPQCLWTPRLGLGVGGKILRAWVVRVYSSSIVATQLGGRSPQPATRESGHSPPSGPWGWLCAIPYSTHRMSSHPTHQCRHNSPSSLPDFLHQDALIPVRALLLGLHGLCVPRSCYSAWLKKMFAEWMSKWMSLQRSDTAFMSGDQQTRMIWLGDTDQMQQTQVLEG